MAAKHGRGEPRARFCSFLRAGHQFQRRVSRSTKPPESGRLRYFAPAGGVSRDAVNRFPTAEPEILLFFLLVSLFFSHSLRFHSGVESTTLERQTWPKRVRDGDTFTTRQKSFHGIFCFSSKATRSYRVFYGVFRDHLTMFAFG